MTAWQQAPWHHGPVAPRHPGTQAPWHPGTMAIWHHGNHMQLLLWQESAIFMGQFGFLVLFFRAKYILLSQFPSCFQNWGPQYAVSQSIQQPIENSWTKTLESVIQVFWSKDSNGPACWWIGKCWIYTEFLYLHWQTVNNTQLFGKGPSKAMKCASKLTFFTLRQCIEIKRNAIRISVSNFM